MLSVVRYSVLVLAVLEAGWITVDGTRALLVGDYVTPRSGPHAGRLGPWAQVLGAIGVAPRATGTKVAFVLYGASWLAVAAAYARGASWAPPLMLLAATGTLWYAPVGTVLGVAQVALLLWLRRGA